MMFIKRRNTTILSSTLRLYKSTTTTPSAVNLLSHTNTNTEFNDGDYHDVRKRLMSTPPAIGLDKSLDLLDQLNSSEFGKFLLKNKGCNGFWTQYIVLHPYKGRITGKNQAGKPLTSLEKFLLNQAPQFLATQERFVIFQKILRDVIKPNSCIASIPCGLMDDLLLLRGKFDNVQAVGIDLDLNTLEQAISNFHTLSADSNYNDFAMRTEQRDAFNLGYSARFDLITSNGLNIYVDDDDQVIELYSEFFKALKPNGILLTSHIVYPPHEYDDDNFELTKSILYDIIGCSFKPRSVESCVSQLYAAGFDVLNIAFDSKQLYPTFVCRRRD